jgi:PAS domain-containing protein
VSPRKSVVLIIAREFATRLATPMFVTDGDGNLVFFNEPAEEVLGRSFAEAGEMSADRWGVLFSVEDLDGNPMPLESMPGGVALQQRRPAHGALRITALDGMRRDLFVMAFPLFTRRHEFEGVVVIVWEEPTAPPA